MATGLQIHWPEHAWPWPGRTAAQEVSHLMGRWRLAGTGLDPKFLSKPVTFDVVDGVKQ